ncbi:co-chaperone DjlA [Aliivibrio fischeri]|uniref:Co-chaperone protein DjlA n=1 Tax=Aliivibrio fischeri TaxID=668 RepID=A0A6N3ZBK4_ALIFS|nr:co-chaperone DjlA [Aliivibrio fischeri]MUJ20559.1 co-chaperone DjlA [Aliivibrio fischeri]MUK39221.1 co-chaperone DjlA [Aliivibrio fischeri]MUK47433.1 co-chaperone DjlA [Aliivibrio fischeri]MUK82822.1 co-chaperone DjlA [Aliivibrio fischeri]MUK86357.1 co-chaperone DjlA [Aliivibrio fischeri]
MQIFGKVLGGFFGFLFGHFFGAVLGIFIGHQFDKAKRMANSGFTFQTGGASQTQRQAEFFHAAYAVMGHVAKAKGQVTREEIQLASMMMDRMNLSDEQKREAQEAFREGKESDFPLRETLRNIRSITGGRYDLLQFFLELQIAAAIADGDIHPSERDVLHIVAEELGFSAEQLEKRLRMQEAAFRFQQGGGFSGHQSGGSHQQGQWQQASSASQLKDAYNLLGISEDADPKTIKRAHRKLMNEHHPDKLVAKGLPPEMMNMAKEKAQEIQAAYDLIKKEKGIK